MPIYKVTDPDSGTTLKLTGDSPPTETELIEIFSKAGGKAPIPTKKVQPSDPEWAGKYPNLYGAYGAGRALVRAGIEGAGTTLGAAGGAFIPVPGTSLLGAGLGYAGSKRIADALLNEPTDLSARGMGMDVALGAAFQGAGSLIGKIPGVRRILSPEVAAIGPEKTVGAEALNKMAYSVAEKTMKVPPSVKQEVRETAINTMLAEKVPLTKGGLNKVKGILGDLEDQMDSAIANSGNKNNLITTDSVLGPVGELRDKLLNTVNGGKLGKELDAVVKRFKKQYGDEITVEKAQEIKQNTNALLKKAYGSLQNVQTESVKQIVRGLKDRIAVEVPEITGVNLRYSQLKTLETAMERSVNRTGNWDWLSLSAAVTGAVVGGTTGKISHAAEATALWRMLKSPHVQSRLAIALKEMGVGSKANMMANTIVESAYNKYFGEGTK